MPIEYRWSRYGLRENPFFLSPAINVWVPDERLNGKLFCEEIVADEIKKLMALISKEQNMIYVNSPLSVLGTGKSSLMANAYWKLKEKRETTIWVEATGGVTASPTLGRIIDSMVREKIFDVMTEKIGEISYNRIRRMLSKYYRQPSPTLTGALTRVLQTAPEETAKKFANIKRSILISSAVELFGYLISLMNACGITRPFIFIDQFEEFVQAHTGASQLRRLGDDMNDLLRAVQNKVTIVATLHPEAESILMSSAGGYIRTFAPISSETMIIVKPMTPDDGIKLASFYLSKYQIQKRKIFDENVLKYICLKTNRNPRDFLTALHNALIEGALQKYIPIDGTFISNESNHSKVLLGASNQWKQFKKGELKLT